MWQRPEPTQKLAMASFIIEALEKKIREEKLIVAPEDIFKMAILACNQAELYLPEQN